jgi:predicted RNase H-like nuclease
MALLGMLDRRAVEIGNMARRQFNRTVVSDDDILDALAAGFTALSGPKRLRSFPEDPIRDAAGLPMEMLYREL